MRNVEDDATGPGDRTPRPQRAQVVGQLARETSASTLGRGSRRSSPLRRASRSRAGCPGSNEAGATSAMWTHRRKPPRGLDATEMASSKSLGRLAVDRHRRRVVEALVRPSLSGRSRSTAARRRGAATSSSELRRRSRKPYLRATTCASVPGASRAPSDAPAHGLSTVDVRLPAGGRTISTSARTACPGGRGGRDRESIARIPSPPGSNGWTDSPPVVNLEDSRGTRRARSTTSTIDPIADRPPRPVRVTRTHDTVPGHGPRPRSVARATNTSSPPWSGTTKP